MRTPVALLLCVVLVSRVSFAHSGGTDENGCHTDSRTGDYHCHNDDGGGGGSASSAGSRNVVAATVLLLLGSAGALYVALVRPKDGCEEVPVNRTCPRAVIWWTVAAASVGLLVGSLFFFRPPSESAATGASVTLMTW